ncbi:MAG: hypothetical protein IPK44_09115 [Candidatus Accumulibacter sp.]|jgi:hypothetical protein|nr:hypothetical protein [Accumulibacter sp.]
MIDTATAQRQRVLDALKLAGEIATTECQEHLRVKNPALRMFELRALGWPIDAVRRCIRDKDGVCRLQLVYMLRGSLNHAE